MKKFALLFVILCACIFTAASAFAENEDMQHGDRQGRGMKEMMHPSMVATPDGGVIVLAGPKLAKYDKDLNLVKEVELKPGPKPKGEMGEMMENMMGLPSTAQPTAPPTVSPPAPAIAALDSDMEAALDTSTTDAPPAQ